VHIKIIPHVILTLKHFNFFTLPTIASHPSTRYEESLGRQYRSCPSIVNMRKTS